MRWRWTYMQRNQGMLITWIMKVTSLNYNKSCCSVWVQNLSNLFWSYRVQVTSLFPFPPYLLPPCGGAARWRLSGLIFSQVSSSEHRKGTAYPSHQAFMGLAWPPAIHWLLFWYARRQPGQKIELFIYLQTEGGTWLWMNSCHLL